MAARKRKIIDFKWIPAKPKGKPWQCKCLACVSSTIKDGILEITNGEAEYYADKIVKRRILKRGKVE